MLRKSKSAFTLTEVLLAVVIVGIIAALVIPAIVTSYQNQVLQKGYEREVLAIRGAVDALAVTENKASFFDTIMYVDSKPSGYAESSGKFLKKYLRVAKYCGDSNGNCFAPKYYEYKNKDKILYKPEFDGACASLKNGMSICLKPQIAAAGVEGLLDLNGPKGPNVRGRDLLTFAMESKTRSVISAGTEEVIALKNTPIVGPVDPECDSCSCNPSLPGCTPPPINPVCANPDPTKPSRCCDTAKISSQTDACCTIDTIKKNNTACQNSAQIYVKVWLGTPMGCYHGTTASAVNFNMYIAAPKPKKYSDGMICLCPMVVTKNGHRRGLGAAWGQDTPYGCCTSTSSYSSGFNVNGKTYNYIIGVRGSEHRGCVGDGDREPYVLLTRESTNQTGFGLYDGHYVEDGKILLPGCSSFPCEKQMTLTDDVINALGLDSLFE